MHHYIARERHCRIYTEGANVSHPVILVTKMPLSNIHRHMGPRLVTSLLVLCKTAFFHFELMNSFHRSQKSPLASTC